MLVYGGGYSNGGMLVYSVACTRGDLMSSIAKGKKMHDKRASIKERDVARDLDRSLS